MKKTTRDVVRKAEQDYVLARHGSRSNIQVHDGVCFHCQQCAEDCFLQGKDEVGLDEYEVRGWRGCTARQPAR